MLNRLLLCGTNSGCGKTTVTMALLAAFKKRGLSVSSFKCGPDYIDPMFHREAIGIPSYNLDPFFCDDAMLRASLAFHSHSDISVIEGVMGYYDGVGTEGRCSTYDVARATETPAVLVINAKGMATSAGALLSGFRNFKSDSNIRGVIFNGVSPMLDKMLSEIAREQGIKSYGCFPKKDELSIGSRNLGLITAAEIEDIRSMISKLGELAEESLDIDGLLALASESPELPAVSAAVSKNTIRARIAYACDKAFCFRYQDNLELLEACGAELVPFSPLSDSALPKGTQGIYLCGGYPELYTRQLSANESMRKAIYEAAQAQMPIFAECGGFMYLHDDIDGVPMCGVIKGSTVRKNRLQRFGYVTVTAKADCLLASAGDTIRAHEFHYYDSSDNGSGYTAERASNGLKYDCCHSTGSLYAGYPHLYFPSNPVFAENFVRKAASYAAI